MFNWPMRQFLIFIMIMVLFTGVPHIMAIIAIPVCIVVTILCHLFTGMSPLFSFLVSLVVLYLLIHTFFLFITRRLDRGY
jgi:hypothetical protein